MEKAFAEIVRTVVREELAAAQHPRGLTDAAGAAKYLNVSRSSIFEFVANGELAVVKHDRILRFDYRELDDWQRRNTQRAKR